MSALEGLYREVILDHYRAPRNRGELPVPPAHRAEGFNPLCGDEVILYLDIDDGVVRDVRTGGQGCSISQASTSMMSAAVKGTPVADVHRLIHAFKTLMTIHESRLDGENGDEGDEGDEGGESDDDTVGGAGQDASKGVKLGDLEALQGVVKFPVRIKCATLAWNTLEQGLTDADPTGDDGEGGER